MPALASAPSLSRGELESLLRHRKLDHTLTSALPPIDPAGARWIVPTGIPDLDARLHGGLPRGHLSDIAGPRSSGRLAVAVSAMAGATTRGEAVAFIDPLDMFDPVSAAASGVDFTRLLWIRGEPSSASRVGLSCEYGTLQKNLDQGVKALNLVLQAGGFGVVVLDLAPLMEVGAQILRRLPYTTWLRLHRVIEGSETACVLIGAEPIARSAGGVTVELAPDSRLRASGLVGPGAWSLESEARVINARVVRARLTRETDRHVCVPVSAAAC